MTHVHSKFSEGQKNKEKGRKKPQASLEGKSLLLLAITMYFNSPAPTVLTIQPHIQFKAIPLS